MNEPRSWWTIVVAWAGVILFVLVIAWLDGMIGGGVPR